MAQKPGKTWGKWGKKMKKTYFLVAHRNMENDRENHRFIAPKP
jgi:hypothetical protein